MSRPRVHPFGSTHEIKKKQCAKNLNKGIFGNAIILDMLPNEAGLYMSNHNFQKQRSFITDLETTWRIVDAIRTEISRAVLSVDTGTLPMLQNATM